MRIKYYLYWACLYLFDAIRQAEHEWSYDKDKNARKALRLARPMALKLNRFLLDYYDCNPNAFYEREECRTFADRRILCMEVQDDGTILTRFKDPSGRTWRCTWELEESEEEGLLAPSLQKSSRGPR